MMPAPTHLKGIIIPREDLLDEEPLIGDVLCKCGSNDFRLMYPGATQEYEGKMHPCTTEINGHFFFLTKAVCTKCSVEYLLFDSDFHGSDGFLCHDRKKASLPRPSLVSWKCLSCGALSHSVTITICSQGKDVFMAETKGEFDEGLWPDAFEWITISIKCNKCGLETKNWVDYETA
jgi:hypothetical protein